MESSKQLELCIKSWNIVNDCNSLNSYLNNLKNDRLRLLSNEECEIVVDIMNELKHKKAERGNKKKWDTGWDQNLKMLVEKVEPNIALTPCYFGKYPMYRIYGKIFVDADINTDLLIKCLKEPEYSIPQIERFESIENCLYRIMTHGLIFEKIRNFWKEKERKN